MNDSPTAPHPTLRPPRLAARTVASASVTLFHSHIWKVLHTHQVPLLHTSKRPRYPKHLAGVGKSWPNLSPLSNDVQKAISYLNVMSKIVMINGWRKIRHN